jgi:hypothetical protein
MSAAKGKGLLDLAAETRVQIYAYLFQNSTLTLRQSQIYGQSSTLAPWRNDSNKYITTPSIEFAVLQTCKQIYREAQPVAADNLTVSIWSSAHCGLIQMVKRYHRACYTRYFQFVKRLDLDFWPIHSTSFLQSFPRFQIVHLRHHGQRREVFRTEVEALDYCSDGSDHDQKVKERAKQSDLSKGSVDRSVEKLLAAPGTFQFTMEAVVVVHYTFDHTITLPTQLVRFRLSYWWTYIVNISCRILCSTFAP